MIVGLLICSVIMAFMRRLPAAVVAFCAMGLAGLTNKAFFLSGQYWFWAVAAVIVTANQYLTEQPPLPRLRYYTVGGALVGCAVGAIFGNMAALIVSGFIGAFLGFEAFRRTPKGQMNAALPRRLMIFADAAIPALVAFFICAITTAQLFIDLRL